MIENNTKCRIFSVDIPSNVNNAMLKSTHRQPEECILSHHWSLASCMVYKSVCNAYFSSDITYIYIGLQGSVFELTLTLC